MNKSIQDYATLLHTAERRRVPLAPLSAEEPRLSTAEAYAIQSASSSAPFCAAEDSR